MVIQIFAVCRTVVNHVAVASAIIRMIAQNRCLVVAAVHRPLTTGHCCNVPCCFRCHLASSFRPTHVTVRLLDDWFHGAHPEQVISIKQMMLLKLSNIMLNEKLVWFYVCYTFFARKTGIIRANFVFCLQKIYY